MTEHKFLKLLNSINFSQRYWDFCDRFPLVLTGQANVGKKEDILAAFNAAGCQCRYDSRDRSYLFEQEQIGDLKWSGVFAKQRHGIELIICGTSGELGEDKSVYIGGSFAGLAYQARQLADPTFERDGFSGPAPYPRPDFAGDPLKLAEIIQEQVLFVREIKNEVRRASGLA